MDLWNQIEVFISLFESTCRGLEGEKMWAKIKVVIRHTVVEQRLFGLPVGCSDFPFCFEQRLYGALLVWLRVQEGFFQLKV